VGSCLDTTRKSYLHSPVRMLSWNGYSLEVLRNWLPRPPNCRFSQNLFLDMSTVLPYSLVLPYAQKLGLYSKPSVGDPNDIPGSSPVSLAQRFLFSRLWQSQEPHSSQQRSVDLATVRKLWRLVDTFVSRSGLV